MTIWFSPECRVWHQPDLVADNEDDDASRVPDVFFMEFRVRDAIVNWTGDYRPVRRLRDVGRKRETSFVVGRDDLLMSRNRAFHCMSYLLSAIGVPWVFHAPFSVLIRLAASLIVNEPATTGRRMIPVVVDIDLSALEVEEEEEEEEDEEEEEEEEGLDDEEEEDEEDESLTEVMSSSFDEAINLVVPASEASINALEKVKAQDVDSTDTCVICLEEFSTGSELSRMPCSHAFHGDCIVQWLERSHACPLCRFKMPAAVGLHGR